MLNSLLLLDVIYHHICERLTLKPVRWLTRDTAQRRNIKKGTRSFKRFRCCSFDQSKHTMARQRVVSKGCLNRKHCPVLKRHCEWRQSHTEYGQWTTESIEHYPQPLYHLLDPHLCELHCTGYLRLWLFFCARLLSLSPYDPCSNYCEHWSTLPTNVVLAMQGSVPQCHSTH